MIEFRERAYVVTGERRGPFWLLQRHVVQSGQRSWVEANWQWALAREEKLSDVCGFYHTHPPLSGVRPSARDRRTMRAWCLAFDKPLLCIIACGDDVQSTLFRDENDNGHALPRTQRFRRGALVVIGEENGG